MTSQMSVQDKILHAIQKHGIASLVDDDAALLELIKQAVNKALFEDKTYSDGYRTNHIPSAISAAARESADVYMKKLCNEFMEDTDIQEKMRQAFISAIPLAMYNMAVNNLGMAKQFTDNEIHARIMQDLANRGIR